MTKETRIPHPETDLLVITKRDPRDNLGRFVPGLSGFAGREHQVSLVAELRNHLKEHPEESKAIIEALVREAKKPNLTATSLILERIDGKVSQEVNIRGVIAHVANEYALAALEYDRQFTQSTQLRDKIPNNGDSEAKS